MPVNIAVSPIVLFAYARPDHTRRTLDALVANELAQDSELFIFIDGARDERDKDNVSAVRSIAESCNGFARVNVIQRPQNYGLARNIIEGVTEIIELYGRVIVVEDDIVTSPYFLKFMNHALNRYADFPKVWHVSGWNCPIDPDGLPDAFFWRGMNCWGWATWQDRWAQFDKDTNRLMTKWSRSDIRRFNLDGAHNFWSQVVGNHSGWLNTWAIFWYATIFENDGLCLNPAKSLTQNIGFDGTGENCGLSSALDGDLLATHMPAVSSAVVEQAEAVRRIRQFYKSTRGSLIWRGIRRILRLTERFR